jgi:hypothetical protein
MQVVKKSGAPLYLALITSTVVTFGVFAAEPQGARRSSDEALKARVHAALMSAKDVPGREITVDAAGGVVTLKGQLSSDSMRGVAYPSAILQQSIGAVVRAVPGVKDVRFSLQVEPAPPAAPAGSPATPPGRGGAPGAR